MPLALCSVAPFPWSVIVGISYYSSVHMPGHPTESSES